MAEASEISGTQFLEMLKQRRTISVLLDAARQVDVSALSNEESRDFARGLRDFAGSKNGPMLIMGLPGPLQALLSFAGTVMPGLDRLGYLKASPRQVVNRLLQVKDERLLAQYQFDKFTKADWGYYLEHCKGAPISPAARFLMRTESAGGFSDKEIGLAVLANRELVNFVPIERIDPDSAAALIVSGTSQLLWQKYDFNRFGKEQWRSILKNLNVTTVPKPCERYLSNEDGKGFSNAELIELAYHCDLVAQWIDLDETTFSDVYGLYVKGKGLELWRRFPFSGLNRSEWEMILKDPRIDIPSAFIEAVNFGMFTTDELCVFAVHNPKIFPFVGIDTIAPQKIIDMLLQCDAQYLWDNYRFEKLSAADWKRLICNYKGSRIVPHAKMLGDSKGMSSEIAAAILEKNDVYLQFVPLVFVEPELALKLLVNGRHEKLWKQYDFMRLAKSDWQALFSKTERIPAQFSEVVKREIFTVLELCSLAKKNLGFIDYIPLEKLSPTAFVDLFLETRSKKLWNGYDFSRITGPQWKRLIYSLKTKDIVSTAKYIKKASGLTTEIVSSLLKVNLGYYKYVPAELISVNDVIKVLLSGECEEFWDEYPFERFSKADWVTFLMRSTRIPSYFKVVVDRELFTLGELCDYARQNEAMVAYLPIALLNNETLTELLILSKTDILWNIGNLRRLSAECWVKLIQNRKPLIPSKYLKPLREVNGLRKSHVRQILSVDYRYYEYLPFELLPHDWVVEHLILGKPGELWQSYPFTLFDNDDWFGLLENTTHAVPHEGIIFLANEHGKVNVARLNALLTKRRELVKYVNPRDIEPTIAVEFLVRKSSSGLWGKYDFRRFTDEQIQLIVKKASERASWPKEISDKFSSSEDAFTDEVILKLAGTNIVNVLDLISPKRIQRSGVAFFEKICGFAKVSIPAISGIRSKLTVGTKPWLELRREYLVVLMSVIPQSRSFIPWQGFELKLLDKLLRTDKVFRTELCKGRKFKLFFWRHWLFILLSVIIVAYIAYHVVCVLQEQARLLEVEKRQNAVIQHINELKERNDYAALDGYISSVAHGIDAHLLKENRTLAARSALSNWKRKREDVKSKIDMLKRFAKDGWHFSLLDSAGECFNSLDDNDTILPSEKNTIVELRRNYDSRRAEFVRQKKNEMFVARITEIEVRCRKSSSVDAVQALLVELATISSDPDINDANVRKCSKARDMMLAKIEPMFKQEFSKVQTKIDMANSVSEIDRIVASAGPLLSSAQVYENVKNDYNSLMAKIAKRKTNLREAAEKEQVESIHNDVVKLRNDLSSADETEFVKISIAYSQLKNKASFPRYRVEYAEEYGVLESEVQKRNNGVARAESCIEAATTCLAAVEGKIASKADVEEVSRHLRELELWKTEFASIVKWKLDLVEQCRLKIANLLDEMKDRLTLVSSINNATDYGALYESIQVLLKKYPGYKECQQIDTERIMNEKQVKSAITKTGWFSTGTFCDFVGLIKVCPKESSDIVPLISKTVDSKAEIYCVGLHYDDDSQKMLPVVRKIFERTTDGGFRKVNGFDYARCQGIGLFICNDPSYVEAMFWAPGSRNSDHPHWVASSKPGVWIVEPGYKKKKTFGGQLSEVEWDAGATYGRYRAGRIQGSWEEKKPCSWCRGCSVCNRRGYLVNPSYTYTCTSCGGTGYKKISYGSRKCYSCDGRGYRWSEVDDSTTVVNNLIRESIGRR